MRGPENSVDLTSIRVFTDRLETMYEGGLDGVYSYGAETYDAVIITALSAEMARSTAPTVLAPKINNITRDGQKCFSFTECMEVIFSGGNPDYDGIGGQYKFVDVGEPSVASFRILTFSGGTRPDPNLDVYVNYGN